MTNLQLMGQNAKAASYVLAATTTAAKNRALLAIADQLEASEAAILAANAQDLAIADGNGVSPALRDRLLLNSSRVQGLANDLRAVARLADPVGEELDGKVLDNGLRLCRRRVPIGVLGVIYEARPNVTIDIAGLALKTGNAAILRGGKETIHSNRILVELIRSALVSCGLPADAVQFIDSPERALVGELLKLDKYVDMIVPRGGAGLHQLCKEQSTIPVITGGMGICHLYIEPSADFARAIEVVVNAKVQRPSACNALDTLLVRQDAVSFIPQVAAALAAKGVELRLTAEARSALGTPPADMVVADAGPEDFDTEWLGLVLGIKVVADIDEAIAHIRAHSCDHSDGILTGDVQSAEHFLNQVNSAAVYVNASTRFTDGGQFGLGAEVAVSTQKLHARGPMGLTELTTYKWVARGDYATRR